MKSCKSAGKGSKAIKHHVSTPASLSLAPSSSIAHQGEREGYDVSTVKISDLGLEVSH